MVQHIGNTGGSGQRQNSICIFEVALTGCLDVLNMWGIKKSQGCLAFDLNTQKDITIEHPLFVPDRICMKCGNPNASWAERDQAKWPERHMYVKTHSTLCNSTSVKTENDLSNVSVRGRQLRFLLGYLRMYKKFIRSKELKRHCKVKKQHVQCPVLTRKVSYLETFKQSVNGG